MSSDDLPRLYAHWSHIKQNDWPARFFKPAELASRGDGSLLVVRRAIKQLDGVRAALGKPIKINSAYRDPIHNAKIGGAPMSRHKFGDAFDISLSNHDKDRLVAVCRDKGFTGFGLRYRTFLHVDCGPARSW